MNAFHLAFAYLRFNWIRSLVLVLVAALILAVPIVSQVLLNGSRDALTNRAEATPLILGSRGSQLDLVMNALYFSQDRAEPVTMQVTETVWDTGLGLPIPMHTAFETAGARIVGTSLEYFDFRGLDVAQGRNIAVLGEAVLGADVAARLGIGAGDTVVSSPENLFDLDGVYPLELNVVGIVAPTGTPDDEAVFVDIKTSWVISGIGHGHDGVMATGAEGEDIVAAASILEFNRITPDNIDSFHFHGDPSTYPVSAIILLPNDARAGTILQGRYLDPENPVQIIVPSDVIGDVIDRIFRIKTLLDATSLIIGTAAIAAIGLAIFLSYRLRAREMQTAFKIGARRGMIIRLLAAETVILLGLAALISFVIILAVQSRGDTIVAWLLAL